MWNQPPRRIGVLLNRIGNCARQRPEADLRQLRSIERILDEYGFPAKPLPSARAPGLRNRAAPRRPGTVRCATPGRQSLRRCADCGPYALAAQPLPIVPKPVVGTVSPLRPGPGNRRPRGPVRPVRCRTLYHRASRPNLNSYPGAILSLSASRRVASIRASRDPLSSRMSRRRRQRRL